MKPKELIKKFTSWDFLIILFISVVTRWGLFNLLYPVYRMTDSYTYTIDYTGNMFLGKTDLMRTPVYPYFYKLVGCFFKGEDVYLMMTYLQTAIGLLSIYYFYKLVKLMTKNKVVHYITTLLYGCLPTISSWEKCILTEALSISGMVIFTYYMVSFIKKPRKGRALGLGIALVVLVLLRPSFIFLVALMTVFWIARGCFIKNERDIAIWGLAGVVISCSILGGYSYLNKKNHNYTALTNVSVTINQLHMLIKNDLYRNPNYEDITEDIALLQIDPYPWWEWDATLAMNKKYEPNDLDDYVKDTIRLNARGYVNYVIEKTKEVMKMPFQCSYTGVIEKPQNIEFSKNVLDKLLIFPRFRDVMILIGASILLFFIKWGTRKKIDWLLIGFATLILGQCVTAIVGAQDEWPRLVAPIVPMVILLATQFILSILSMRRANEATN